MYVFATHRRRDSKQLPWRDLWPLAVMFSSVLFSSETCMNEPNGLVVPVHVTKRTPSRQFNATVCSFASIDEAVGDSWFCGKERHVHVNADIFCSYHICRISYVRAYV